VRPPRVAVVGGGLAGLSAAVACADAGARVALFESRPRLGGATWSFERGGLRIDNGTHVFLRCCTAYRGFLERIGSAGHVELQPRLAVPVLAPGGRVGWLGRGRLPAPLHLAPSLLCYPHLTLVDRLRAARAAHALARLDPDTPGLDARSFGDWLREQGQSPAAIARLWDLIGRPTLNLGADEASLAQAVFVFRIGLLDGAAAGDLGLPRVPLQDLHAEPAARLLASLGAEVHLRARVTRVESGSGRLPRLRLAGAWREAEAVIVAAPHREAAALLPPEAGLPAARLARLGRSPIVNLHLVYDRRVTGLAFAAGVGSCVEWIFDRSAAAGLERGQYLAVSLSAADAWLGQSSEALRRRFAPEIARLLPAARSAALLRFFATCEPEATFRAAPGARRLRPGPRTRAPGVFLAGAWTDTGWPATMEGAVRSGQTAALAALRELGRARPLPAVAA
jgi:squalene-associated FAD-dependent desaturase